MLLCLLAFLPQGLHGEFPNVGTKHGRIVVISVCWLVQVQHPVMGFDGCLVASPPPPPAATAAGLSPAFVLSPYGTLTERLHVCPEFVRGQCSVEVCPFAHPGEYDERERERE